MKLKEMNFNDSTTVGEVRKFLTESWEEGCVCPSCKQQVRLTRRTIYSTVAFVLVLIYREQKRNGGDWVHVQHLLREHKVQNTDFSKTEMWGLLERKIDKRSDESNRVGYWRLTLKGIEFVTGRLRIQKYARTYNQKFYGLAGEMVSIRNCFGKDFDYREIMGSDFEEHEARDDAQDVQQRLI